MNKTILAMLFLSFSGLWARDIPVPNVAALAGALGSAGPGDVIVLAKGNWSDAVIKVERGGFRAKPVDDSSRESWETILMGGSQLEINAPYVVVDGLYFLKGVIDTEKFSVIHFKSHHGTVRNCAVVDYNPPEFEDEYYWAYFSGDNNLLEKCYFKGKNNMHPLLGNAIDGSRTNTVRSCYFKNIPYEDGNGREILRMWGPGKFDPKDKDGAFCVVEGNLFEGADGEGTEIISLKSNYNQVLSNTIVGSRGCLNIRQGSHNLVKGNILLGKGVVGAQGLRMSGFDNTVEGNYVSGCEWGIRIQTGEYTESGLTPSYQANMKEKKSKKGEATEVNVAKYPPVEDLVLARNVSVNNTGADLEVGFAYKRHWPENQLVLLPENCQIKDNQFIRSSGGESVIGSVADTQPPLDKIKLKPNHFENNVLMGGSCAYSLASSGFKIQAIPNGWSEEKEIANWKPLTPDEVGPAWVIVLRKAGQFAVEDDLSCARAPTDKAEKKKKKKKKD